MIFSKKKDENVATLFLNDPSPKYFASIFYKKNPKHMSNMVWEGKFLFIKAFNIEGFLSLTINIDDLVNLSENYCINACVILSMYLICEKCLPSHLPVYFYLALSASFRLCRLSCMPKQNLNICHSLLLPISSLTIS